MLERVAFVGHRQVFAFSVIRHSRGRGESDPLPPSQGRGGGRAHRSARWSRIPDDQVARHVTRRKDKCQSSKSTQLEAQDKRSPLGHVSRRRGHATTNASGVFTKQ